MLTSKLSPKAAASSPLVSPSPLPPNGVAQRNDQIKHAPCGRQNGRLNP